MFHIVHYLSGYKKKDFENMHQMYGESSTDVEVLYDMGVCHNNSRSMC